MYLRKAVFPHPLSRSRRGLLSEPPSKRREAAVTPLTVFEPLLESDSQPCLHGASSYPVGVVILHWCPGDLCLRAASLVGHRSGFACASRQCWGQWLVFCLSSLMNLGRVVGFQFVPHFLLLCGWMTTPCRLRADGQDLEMFWVQKGSFMKAWRQDKELHQDFEE